VALVIAAAALVGIALFLGREALSPFIVGLLLVYLLDPPVERLARRGVPRWLAVLVVYVIAIVALVEVLNLTLRPLVDEVRRFVADLPALADRLDQQLRGLGDLYRGLELPAPLREAIDGWLADLSQSGVAFDPGVLLPVVNVTAGLVGALFGYIIIPVWVFYLLKDRPALTQAFDRALPAEWRADVREIVRLVERVFGQWVRGQLILGLTVAIATFVGLMLLSATVDPIFGRFAVLLALVAGLLELLPIIGPIIAAIPAVLLAATAGPQAILAALALYILIQQVENNVLVPKIQGDAVELHPGAVMFALVIGGAIAGFLGAILSLPVTAASRDVFRYLFRRLSADSPPAIAAVDASGTMVAETSGSESGSTRPASLPDPPTADA
jgi:predicted PurR-regulated permease PerM